MEPLPRPVRRAGLRPLARRRLSALVFTSACLGALLRAAAADPVPPLIANVHDFYAIAPENTARAHRFRWDLNILYSDPTWNLLWVENAGLATFVSTAADFPQFAAGQRVRFEGELVPERGLSLDGARWTVLPEPSPLQPRDATGHLADSGQFNNTLVTLEAVVDEQSEPDRTHLMLEASAEGLHVLVRVRVPADVPRPRFEGTLIRATGVYVGHRNFVGDLTSVALWVSDLSGIQIRGTLEDSAAFAGPIVRIEQLAEGTGGHPVHVVGTVHAFDSTAPSITLRDATGQVVVSTAQTHGIRVGQELEAVGLPEVAGVHRRLRNASVRPLGARPAAPAEPPPAGGALRLADQVLALKADAAAGGQRVQLFGVATWIAADRTTLFLQDATAGLEVRLPPGSPPPPNLPCSARIEGVTARGAFAPLVNATTLTWSNPLGSPEPRRATFEEMLTGNLHGHWVSTEGCLRAIHRTGNAVQLEFATATGDFVAWLPPENPPSIALGSIVTLQGVCFILANDRHQLASIRLLVPSPEHLAVTQAVPPDPFALPVRSIAGLREFGPSDSALRRLCTAGTVLYHEPGRYLCLQDDNDTLLVLSTDTTALAPGDRVEVVGLAGREGSRLVLREALYRRMGRGAEPPATPLAHPETSDALLDGRLVRLEGVVTALRTQQGEACVTVRNGDRLFDGVLAPEFFAPARYPVGSRVALCGVYRAIYDEARRPIAFALRLRHAGDIAVLAAPPLWTVPRALGVAGVLLLLTAAVAAWLAVLRARVARQTAQIQTQLARENRLEAELARAQRIESLGVLAGGIAHDFNNLLTGILANLGLAKLDPTAAAAVGDCLREAERASLRARDLTQRLLIFTKGAPPVKAVVSLPPLVRESVTFGLRGSNVRCAFDLPDDLWPAEVDRVQIGQVVQNLAINAQQAMPRGGTFQLAAINEFVAAGSHPPLAEGRYLRLTASDSGTGIPADILRKIFDPYFTTKERGNGLGLATVYSIVRRHGGHIEVESAPGVGTTFRLWLPAAAAEAVPVEPGDPPAATTPAAAPAAPARVLVLDDDAALRRAATLALLHAGHEAIATGDGREAVELFVAAAKHEHPFALLLLDLTIPGGMGGEETLAALRHLDPKVRAIVTSGHGNSPAFLAYRKHGFDAALAKPYEIGDLLALVATVLAAPSR